VPCLFAIAPGLAAPFATLAESYVHRLDPFAVRLGEGGFGVRWYGLAYMAGFLVAWLAFRRTGRRGQLARFDAAAASDLVLPVILGVVVGGRAGYAFFYDPSLLTGFSRSFPFWDLFALWKGGMASHGGMIGAIAGVVWFARGRGTSALALLDVAAWAVPFGLCFGRLANFVNAELWGRTYPDQAAPPWWTVKYPEEVLARGFARAGEVEAAMLDLVVPRLVEGESILQATVRLARDGNAEVIDRLAPFLTAYWPSQLVQALAEGPVLFAVLTLAWLRPRKPGVIGAIFLLTYAVLRVLTETVRQPDEGVALLLGLSRGQVLSVAMFVIAAGCLLWTTRRRAERVVGPIGPLPATGGADQSPPASG